MAEVNVTLTNGNLGRVAASTDGVSGLIVTGVAVSGQFALGDVLGPFVSITEVEAKGINAAYDVTNTCCAHLQCQEFFDNAKQYGAKGTKLYVMVAAKTVTMETMCDKTSTYVKKMLQHGEGAIKLVGISRVPDGGYTPAYTAQLEDDMWDAIVKLKELWTEQFGLNRPFDAFIEGRNWQGTVSSTQDLRNVSSGPNANRVSIVIGQSKEMNDHGGTVAACLLAASVGAALGSAAALSVQRSIARVKNGPVFTSEAFTSDGEPLTDLTSVDIALIQSLQDKGYIFLRGRDGKPGLYWSCDANACPITDDYADKSRSRPIDKVVRIAAEVYMDDYEDDIALNPETGKMAVEVIKGFQERITVRVDQLMTSRGELSGFTAYCDPDQDVITDDEIDVELLPVPKGKVKAVNVTVGYSVGSN